ncbi:hypothetical protein JVU11DRAFT_9183 [Chiua virens]|nr:hypothetical protein JVU11DRAFT_9183 [Chiua virens]
MTTTTMFAAALELWRNTFGRSDWHPRLLHCGPYNKSLNAFSVKANGEVHYLWIPSSCKFAFRLLNHVIYCLWYASVDRRLPEKLRKNAGRAGEFADLLRGAFLDDVLKHWYGPNIKPPTTERPLPRVEPLQSDHLTAFLVLMYNRDTPAPPNDVTTIPDSWVLNPEKFDWHTWACNQPTNRVLYGSFPNVGTEHYDLLLKECNEACIPFAPTVEIDNASWVKFAAALFSQFEKWQRHPTLNNSPTNQAAANRSQLGPKVVQHGSTESLDHTKPYVSDAQSSSATVRVPSARIVWESPQQISMDQTPATMGITGNAAVVIDRSSLTSLSFDKSDIARLRSPTAWLNDTCINGCIALLCSSIRNPHSEKFAIFSTYDLHFIKSNQPDDHIWRNTKRVLYWTKPSWIIPIHRPTVGREHWVLCVVHVSHRELFLYDSLAKRRGWQADVKEIMKLISRLHGIAAEHHKEFHADTTVEWVARPILLEAVQTNGYDCGVWVLSTVAALLRGHDATELKERDMLPFRRYLHDLVLSIS